MPILPAKYFKAPSGCAASSNASNLLLQKFQLNLHQVFLPNIQSGNDYDEEMDEGDDDMDD